MLNENKMCFVPIGYCYIQCILTWSALYIISTFRVFSASHNIIYLRIILYVRESRTWIF